MQTAAEQLAAMLSSPVGNPDRREGRWTDHIGQTLPAAMYARPAVTVDLWNAPTNSADIEYTISTFHYLRRQLATNILCADFARHNAAADAYQAAAFDQLGPGYGIAREAGQWLAALKPDEDWDDHWHNTHNYHSNLSQGLQLRYFEIPSADADAQPDYYAIIQTHNGDDIRAGYSAARLFVLVSGEPWLASECVEGVINDVAVSTDYDGHTLTNANGADIDFPAGAAIDLHLAV